MAFAPTPRPIEDPQEVPSAYFRRNFAECHNKVREGEALSIVKHGTSPVYLISKKHFSTFEVLRKIVAASFDSAISRLSSLGADASEISGQTVSLAVEIVTELKVHMSVAPDRVVPLKDGGIDIYFFSPSKDAAGSPKRMVCINVSEDDGEAEAAILFSSCVEGGSASEMLTNKTNAQELATQIEDFLIE